jgi:hypothetical protein
MFALGILVALFAVLASLLYAECTCQRTEATGFERLLLVAQWGSIALGIWIVVLALILLFDR